MSRLLRFATITALALMVVAAQAQIRPSGPPASVTSIQPNPIPGGTVFNGPAASVNSPRFGNIVNTPLAVPHHGGRRHDHRGNGRFGNSFTPAWAYSPTLVPVPVPVDENGNPIQATDPDPEEESPAYTVFERRSRSAIPPVVYNDDRYRNPAGNDETAQQENVQTASVPAQPTTLLIFRDGHRLEITNYAIQSGTLFNLSDNGPHKIALADLDLDATVRANDDRGVDFTAPAAR